VTPLNGKGMLIISKGGQEGWYWHIVGGQWYVVWAKNMVKTGDQHTPTLEFLPVLRQQKDQNLGSHHRVAAAATSIWSLLGSSDFSVLS
jgi:hypothetical protein